MISWPGGGPARFDHRLAGWPLRQSHDTLACEKCHAMKYRTAPAAALSVRKSGAGWIGLTTDCAACHEDPHQGGLGSRCAECHDASTWKAAPGFSHDSTDYPLTGKHASVKCAECHENSRPGMGRARAATSAPVFSPVAHASCADCHTDPHAGQLGPKCADCHVTTGFGAVEKGRFDHNRTRYRLTGAHATVACADCHGKFGTAGEKRPGFATCTACHRDPHGGTATVAGQAVDCAACHGTAGFAPATLAVAEHARTRYPLQGRHAKVDCARCHGHEAAEVPRWGTARVIMRPAFERCEACHSTEAHGSQLASLAAAGECAACHVVGDWKPSLVDEAAHARTRLPLDGRHGEISCRACHGAERKGIPALAVGTSGKSKFLFRIPEVTCSACHQDPHGGRLAEAGARARRDGCLACHDTRTFRPSTSDVAGHVEFGFALDGAHRATPCFACHEEMKRPSTPRSASLVGGGRPVPALFEAKRDCSGCHQDIHGAQFAGRSDGGRCDACHGVEGFAPATRFDHVRNARFSTKGAHSAVPCIKCHPHDPASKDPRALVYRPVSSRCESCHAGAEAR
jgi:hypothetical protein